MLYLFLKFCCKVYYINYLLLYCRITQWTLHNVFYREESHAVYQLFQGYEDVSGDSAVRLVVQPFTTRLHACLVFCKQCCTTTLYMHLSQFRENYWPVRGQCAVNKQLNLPNSWDIFLLYYGVEKSWVSRWVISHQYTNTQGHTCTADSNIQLTMCQSLTFLAFIFNWVLMTQ